jgi:hypothetical protein
VTFPIVNDCGYPSRIIERFLRNVDVRGPGECWDWRGYIMPNGYGQISDRRQGTTVTHRLALELSSGRRIPPGMLALHSCDRRCCNAPHHLRVGDHRDNARDAVERGRHRPARICKVDETGALSVIEAAAAGEPYPSIAARVGLSAVQVHNIAAGKSWAHLPRPASLVAAVEARRPIYASRRRAA